MPAFPSLTALDTLLDQVATGHPTRRRQLGMVRAELTAALDRDALGVPARRGLLRLLADDTLHAYVRLAETGALRSRLLAGNKPPTSRATNAARHDCLRLLREAAGLPAWHPQHQPVPPRPITGSWELARLRERLGELATGFLTPGQTRFVAMLALAVDTEARSGELAALRITDLAPDLTHVRLVRRPQRGTSYTPEPQDAALTPLTRTALDRWLPVRSELVAQAHGTSRLWVSVWLNHSGVPDENGHSVLRPVGMPLEERGLIRAYRDGRRALALDTVLPPKLEQLRRGSTDHRRKTTPDGGPLP